jgi:hypothetical protein
MNLLYIIHFHEKKNMDLRHTVNEFNINGEDICLADSATTHTILKYKQYFSNLRMMKEKSEYNIKFNRLD